MLLGLRTVIYPVSDLDAAKRAVVATLGVEPYFDEPFYVGFQVAGYELALDPNGEAGDGPTTYWGVGDLDAALTEYVAAGATVTTPAQDVGDGIRTAIIEIAPVGAFGLIQNPHFQVAAVEPDGPGR